MTTDTDRELLELAAKAAGFEYTTTEDHDRLLVRGADKLRRPWDPLADDGDALRLAVALNLSISHYPIYENPKHSVLVELQSSTDCPRAAPLRFCPDCTDPYLRKPGIAEIELRGSDPYAATRRAIVRAAAEIGRGMK